MNTEDDRDTEVSDYSDYQIWPSYNDSQDEAEAEAEGEGEYYEYDPEGKVYDKEIEEKKEERKKLKPPELIDIFADLVLKFRDIGADRIAAKTEERKEKLRQLIGLKEETEGSEETLITPEDESDTSSVLSSEGSLNNCLRDIEISNSQLKLRNLYTTFPVPDDPGIIPAFWILHEQMENYVDNSVNIFINLMKKTKLQPIKMMKEMLLSNKISLQYYGINPRVVRPLCDALMTNHKVEVVNLTGNWLSEDACYHLSELLERNNTIHTMLLAGCRIGAVGAWRLQDGISGSQTLITLDLSECNLGAEGLKHIASAVRESDNLQKLFLNDNNLDESCVNELAHMITSSETLAYLGLSWNSLYAAETWRKLGRAIEANNVLVEVDLSWNALGYECANQLRLLLSRSTPLKKLNMTGNRFNEEDAVIIARGLSKNTVLEELYLGNNPLKAEGAFQLIQAITPQVSPQSELRILDLTNIWAKKNALPGLEAIKEGRPWVQVNLGGILSNHKIEGPDVTVLLFKRANYEAMKPKKKQHRKNFGHFVLSLEDNFISKSKFLELVKKFKLKLSSTLVNAIAKAFAGPRKTVNMILLKSVYMAQYPNTEPPPEKPEKKKKKKAKDKTKLKKKETAGDTKSEKTKPGKTKKVNIKRNTKK